VKRGTIPPWCHDFAHAEPYTDLYEEKKWLSMLQVVGGGALVFVAALIFGNA
jgi:hypothetical protein